MSLVREHRDFIFGPLNKNNATNLLESLIHNLLNKNVESIFSMVNSELILEQKNKNVIGDPTSIKHNITLLLQYINFSQIGSFENHELDYYLEKMKIILEERNETSYDSFFVNNEQKHEEDKTITRAYKLAVNFYTQTFNINPFFRGELSRFSSIPSKENSNFQNDCFLLLTSGALTQDFLRRQPTEIIPDTTSKTTGNKSVKSVRGLRIELFKGEAPLFNDLRKLSNPPSQSVTKYSKGFTSYSEEKLGLTQPGLVMDFTQLDENLIPVFHAKDDVHILIHQTHISGKNLSEYSHYEDEQEILAQQSAKETQIINKTGNFLFLQTEQASAANLVPDDNYLVELALRYIYENILQFPYPKPYDQDPDCKVELQDIEGKRGTVVRSNHGLAHAARQARMIEDLLPLFASHGRDDELKYYAAHILHNPDLKNVIQIAAAFLTVGRVNESRAIHDPVGHKKSRENSRNAFENYLSIYYPANQCSDELKEVMRVCANAIFYLAPHAPDTLKTPREKVICHLLIAAHTLDIPRVPGLWKEAEKPEESKVSIAEELLDKLLYGPNGIFDSGKRDHLDREIKSLWDVSLKRLFETGDRIDQIMDYRGEQFIEFSQNPSSVAQVLGITKPLPIVIRDKPSLAVDKKIYFDALTYALTYSKDPDEQLNIFKNEIEFSDLLYFAGQYLENHTATQLNVHITIITKIQDAFNSPEFQQARQTFIAPKITAMSFGEGMDDLPHILKTAIPILREAKVASPENIQKLKKIYRVHPQNIYAFVEDLHYVASKDMLNLETFQLMCLLEENSFNDLMKLLENYTYNRGTPNIYASVTELYSTQVQCQKNILFTMASNLGKIDLVTKLLNQELDPKEKLKLISSNSFLALTFAVKN